MPINAHPEYLSAEKEYHASQTPEEKLKALEKMISEVPKHKGGENLRAQLKTRYKKLKEQIIKSKKSGKSSKQGIKKEDMQAIIIGMKGVGKSSLLSILTNAKPKISPENYVNPMTTHPAIGMMNYATTQIQIIENPAIESYFYDKGLTNTGDVILILVTDLNQISQIEKEIKKSYGKKIIVFNKSDILNEKEKRKISATLQSKKYNFVLTSTKTQKNIEEEVIEQRTSSTNNNDFSIAELKEKIFQNFDKLRIYTKEPNKKEKSKKPVILPPNSMIKDVAEKILKGFSEKIKQTRIWGPSSKFSGQIVGLNHKLKDLDVVEFKTK